MKQNTHDTDCETTRDALLLADGSAPLEAEAVRHLKLCESCRAFQALVKAAARSCRLVDPPAKLDAAVLAYAERRLAAAPRVLRFPVFLRFAAAAALLAVAAVGAWLAFAQYGAENALPRVAAVPTERVDHWPADEWVEELVVASLWLDVAGVADEWDTAGEWAVFSPDIEAELYALQAEFVFAALTGE